jgi:hypothetical protein
MELIDGNNEFPYNEGVIDFTPTSNYHEWEITSSFNPHEMISEYGDQLEILQKNPKELYNILVTNVMEIENINRNTRYLESADSLVKIFYRTFDYMIKSNTRIKKCAHCGKYFVPLNRSDTIYCDRQSPQDPSKTCKEVGARQTWQRTLKENEAAKLYRNIYMARQMKVKRNPDLDCYKKSFEQYKVESRQWKADVKDGVKTEADYVAWLKSEKERRN